MVITDYRHVQSYGAYISCVQLVISQHFPDMLGNTIDVGKIPKMLGTYYGCWDIPYMLTIIIIVMISDDYLSFFIHLLLFIIIYC